MTTQTYPSEKVIGYGYDDKGELVSISIDGTPFIKNIKTNDNGLQSYESADGSKYTRTYDTNGRVATNDSNAQILWKWESKPFGESKATGDINFNLRFPGQYYDNETGTHYNINRDYNPVTGRYIQSDPIGFDGGINGFAYVGGRPIMGVDYLGTMTYIISNLNSGYLFGWGGTHTGLIVINDKNLNGSKSFLYDPSGSYRYKDIWGDRHWLGSGRIQYQEVGDSLINITDYYNYQIVDGQNVKFYFYNTSEEDEKRLLQEADAMGGGGSFDCTKNISFILSKTKKFKSINEVWFPVSLSTQLDNL